jgi:hypothetical protein
MKRSLVTLALLAAFAANAQDSNSNSTANAGASSNPVVSNGTSNSSSGVSGVVAASSSDPNNSATQMIQLNTFNPDQTHATVDSTSTQNSVVSGGVTNRNINEGTSTQNVHYSGSQTVKNVPGIAMSGPASGPCTGASGGIGLAGPGWGVGLNGSAVMDDCRMRENTRVLGMGMQSLDGAANPQEKGEATVMFMDAMRGLAAYNRTLIDKATKESK